MQTKLGKVISTAKNEGVAVAWKKIQSGVSLALHPIGHGDVVFITPGVGDGALHRCHHSS